MSNHSIEEFQGRISMI